MKLQLVPLFQSCTSNLSVINIWPPYQNNSVVNMHFLGYSVSDSIKMKRHLLNKKIFLQKILFLTGWKTLASLVPIYRLITESKDGESDWIPKSELAREHWSFVCYWYCKSKIIAQSSIQKHDILMQIVQKRLVKNNLNQHLFL